MPKIIKEWNTSSGHLALAICYRTGGHINGYIGVPESSPLYGVDVNGLLGVEIPNKKFLNEIGAKYYDKIDKLQHLDVHGGVTYSDYGKNGFTKEGFYFIGFDTNHSSDLQSKDTALKYFTEK